MLVTITFPNTQIETTECTTAQCALKVAQNFCSDHFDGWNVSARGGNCDLQVRVPRPCQDLIVLICIVDHVASKIEITQLK